MRLEFDHGSRPGREQDAGPPGCDHHELWSVVRDCHHARLSYPEGPDYHHRLIVDYRTDGEMITVELPITEVRPEDLHQRLISLEILDEYLSVTAEHVQLTGRAEIATPPPERPVRGGPPWAVPAGPRPTIVVTPLCVDRQEL
jgi:hypothetical protein